MKYSIEDTTLTALGDAVRAKTSETRIEYYYLKHYEIDRYDTSSTSGTKYETIDTYHIPGVKKVKLSLLNGSLDSFLNVYMAGVNSGRGFNFPKELDENNESTIEAYDSNDDIRFAVSYKYNTQCYMEVNLTFYDANDNQLEFQKEVVNTLTPAQMVEEINNLLPPPPETAFKLTGSCQYKFANGGWDWFIEQYGDKITTENISNADHMFYGCKREKIPFDINMYAPAIENMFKGCGRLTTIPNVNFKEITSHHSYSSLFRDCCMIQELPDWLGDLLEADYNITDKNNCWQPWENMFYNCANLRRIPDKVMRYLKNTSNTSGHYYGLAYSKPFGSCLALDELVNIHCDGCEFTSNQFTGFFGGLYRVKDITFATEEDGTPCVRKWKSQVIDLTQSIGYTSGNVVFSLISTDKKVETDEDYQALKNDPDWYTQDYRYSRYNHDSAVNTINSLPDTSAYGTNTIKFKGAAGELTDGGAINTLTDEEIAVAAAKGWTVSLV